MWCIKIRKKKESPISIKITKQPSNFNKQNNNNQIKIVNEVKLSILIFSWDLSFGSNSGGVYVLVQKVIENHSLR